MKNSIIKTAIIPAAAMLLTACSEAERTEEERSAPEAVATLYTLQSEGTMGSPRVAANPVAYYNINGNAGYIYARTTDGKVIYASTFTLIRNK